MVNFYNNLSPATKLLIQSFLAVLGAALAGGVTAAYQSYALSQQLNLAVLVNIFLATFSLLFGKAMHDWIPAHAQQLLQAANDEKAALQDALQRSQQISSAVIATQGKQVQSASPQSQIQPMDVQALSQQLALNLMNMAKPAPAQSSSGTLATTPPAPEPDPYIDPLAFSAKLPAYVPPVASGTAIQNLGTPVQFQAPARQSVIMP